MIFWTILCFQLCIQEFEEGPHAQSQALKEIVPEFGESWPQPSPAHFRWIWRHRNPPNYSSSPCCRQWASCLFFSSLSAFNCPWWHLVMVTYVCAVGWEGMSVITFPPCPPPFFLSLSYTHTNHTLQYMIHYRETSPTTKLFSICTISPDDLCWITISAGNEKYHVLKIHPWKSVKFKVLISVMSLSCFLTLFPSLCFHPLPPAGLQVSPACLFRPPPLGSVMTPVCTSTSIYTGESVSGCVLILYSHLIQ